MDRFLHQHRYWSYKEKRFLLFFFFPSQEMTHYFTLALQTRRPNTSESRKGSWIGSAEEVLHNLVSEKQHSKQIKHVPKHGNPVAGLRLFFGLILLITSVSAGL